MYFSQCNIIFFSNILDNTSEDSYEKSSKTSEEDEHIFLGVLDEEDKCDVTTLNYKQLLKLNANLIKEHDKFEKNNV